MRKQLVSTLLTLSMVLSMLLALTTPAIADGNMGKANQPNTISVGGLHTAVITLDGSLWTWGENSCGQLGNGTNKDSKYPIAVMDNVASVSAGGYHTAAIISDGSLWTWGSNSHGKLGNGTTVDSKTPIKVLDNVVSVSAGMDYTAAISTDGSLWVWGDNARGQLGNGTNDPSYLPIKVMNDVTAVSAGNSHLAAITSDGSLWTWGWNHEGQLGNGTTVNSNTPIKVMDNVVAVSAGTSHTAAITSDGSLWTWGLNFLGRLGSGTIADSIIPIKVMSNVVAVSAGGDMTAAITSDGSLWTWGNNSEGQLGNGGGGNVTDEYDGCSYQTVPTKVMDNIVAVDADGCTMAATTDGSLWAWGSSWHGQLGNGGGGNAVNKFGEFYQTVPLKIMDNVALPIDSTESAVGGFTDVNQSNYYADAVLWAVKNDITNGTSKKTFSPDTTCNQAQILTFLWRAKGEPAPATAVTGDYYAEAAQWAREQGLTNNFSAEAPCTRAMVVTYLWKLAGSPNMGFSTFSDVPSNADYSQAVAWAVARGITTGTSTTNNTFSPDMTCTRGQIVTFLYRTSIAQTVESEPLVIYNGLQYKLVTHNIQEGNVRSINISEWHPLMGFTEAMLSPADGVEETEGINSGLNTAGDVVGFITGFIANSYEIKNLQIITNSDMEMSIRYGDAIELNKSGKKTSLTNLLIEKYSSAYPSILFSADKKADELIRNWFGLGGDGQYSMEMGFGRVHVGDCGYYLTIEDGLVYQIPILHENTKLNVYYKEGKESKLLFDAADVIRNIKIKMSEEEAIKVINRLNSEGYHIE